MDRVPQGEATLRPFGLAFDATTRGHPLADVGQLHASVPAGEDARVMSAFDPKRTLAKPGYARPKAEAWANVAPRKYPSRCRLRIEWY